MLEAIATVILSVIAFWLILFSGAALVGIFVIDRVFSRNKKGK